MKKLFLISIITILFFGKISGQNSNIESEYDRVGVSLIHINYNDKHSSDIRNFISNYPINARYDINNISTKEFTVNDSREVYKKVAGEKVYELKDRREDILEFLNNEKVAHQVINYLFNRKDNGFMDMEKIHYKGLYNATDQDYIKSSSTKRGINELKDSGEELLDDNYIVVIDQLNTRIETENSEKYYHTGYVTYLYKIKFDENKLNEIWDCWVDESTARDEINKKVEDFNNILFEVELIDIEQNKDISVQQTLYNNAYQEVIEKSIYKSFYEFENKNQDLSLKSTIYKTKPIMVKIGKKEGVKTDHAFNVYELIGGKDDEISKRKVGVVKATNKIGDNKNITSGDSEPSEFYQFTGKTLEPGLVIQEKKMINLGVEIGYTALAAGGLNIGVEYDMYSGKNTQLFFDIRTSFSSTGFNVGAGVGYGYRMSNFQIYPLAGVYYDALLISNLTEEQERSNYAYIGQIGIKANINIMLPFQLYIHGGYNIGFAKGATYELYNPNETLRSISGLFASAGIRLYF